jgi:hypothetical protein
VGVIRRAKHECPSRGLDRADVVRDSAESERRDLGGERARGLQMTYHFFLVSLFFLVAEKGGCR